jgi:Raf kinase inhibitor-like YbhB/YbcL family protein
MTPGRAAAAALVMLVSCGGGHVSKPSTEEAPRTIRVTSEAFDDGGTIPTRYTCDGRNISPPIAWTGAEGESTALVVTDPDAPGGEFVHWIVYLARRGGRFEEGALTRGAREGTNSFGQTGYGGPCPPEGDPPHHYRFTVYALPKGFSHPAGDADPSDAVADIRSAAVAFGVLSATYGR